MAAACLIVPKPAPKSGSLCVRDACHRVPPIDTGARLPCSLLAALSSSPACLSRCSPIWPLHDAYHRADFTLFHRNPLACVSDFCGPYFPCLPHERTKRPRYYVLLTVILISVDCRHRQPQPHLPEIVPHIHSWRWTFHGLRMRPSQM